jgi:hypothetical protein
MGTASTRHRYYLVTFMCLTQVSTWISNVICRALFYCVQRVMVRGDWSFCWYWWKCWPWLFKNGRESVNRRTDNTMAKRQKDRQYNGQQTEGQTIQWPKDRRTDNTMAKRKRTKGQTSIYKALHRKHEPHLKLGWTQVLRKDKQFLFQ